MAETIETPFSTVGYLVYKRTYARRLSEADERTEEFPDTIERVIKACDKQFGCNFSENEENRLRRYMLQLKGIVAGRYLWQAGTPTVDRIGLFSLQNCAYTTVDAPVVPFIWAMDALALGSGVGFNIQRHNVDKIPPVKPWFKPATRVNDAGADYVVSDSREGWVKLLAKVLKAAFLSERPEKGTFTFSTQVVRSKGTPIKGFGGVASGPEELVFGIKKIGDVLAKRVGKKLRPIDALDIMNIIGEIIVAGNVRRSAMIAIGDPDDIEFLLAKNWSFGNIPSHRAMSNNSVACDDVNDLHEFFWKGYEGGSEPYGLINMKLARSCGRLGETQYQDPSIEGFNPCGEQGLAPYETCCLSTIFLPNISSLEEFIDVATLLYRVNKHSLQLKAHHPETDAIVKKNQRMGISLTGILQATPEQLSWRDEVYEHLREYDARYSKLHGFNPSVKLTTIQPSGTLSLIPGVVPGVHPGYATYMFRRIRIASNHPLVNLCRDHGYPVEYQRNLDGKEDYNTVVVTFPFAYPEGTTIAAEMTALDQLAAVRDSQEHWSDNSVSCTIYYKREELPAIKEYLEKNYSTKHKTLSFLLHSEHGFAQAPYQEISKSMYEELASTTRLITSISSADFEAAEECVGGMCPVK